MLSTETQRSLERLGTQLQQRRRGDELYLPDIFSIRMAIWLVDPIFANWPTGSGSSGSPGSPVPGERSWSRLCAAIWTASPKGLVVRQKIWEITKSYSGTGLQIAMTCHDFFCRLNGILILPLTIWRVLWRFQWDEMVAVAFFWRNENWRFQRCLTLHPPMRWFYRSSLRFNPIRIRHDFPDEIPIVRRLNPKLPVGGHWISHSNLHLWRISGWFSCLFHADSLLTPAPGSPRWPWRLVGRSIRWPQIWRWKRCTTRPARTGGKTRGDGGDGWDGWQFPWDFLMFFWYISSEYIYIYV